MTHPTVAINLCCDGRIDSAASSTSRHHQHITAERLAAGHYQVHGVLGLASQGWRTTIPRDDNGQPLLTLETSAEGETLGVYISIDGEPVDIPESRVVTLRMDATEPPEEETELEEG